MLEEFIKEKLILIFGPMQIYFDWYGDPDTTQENYIKVNNIRIMKLNYSRFVSSQRVRLSLSFPVWPSGLNIHNIIEIVSQYNKTSKDNTNIVYPYDVGTDISVTLETVVETPTATVNSDYDAKELDGDSIKLKV